MTESQASNQAANASKETCLRVLISGQVQGVGYRYSTREKAIALGIVGWVRNLPDGRVEAMIAGAAAPTDSMMQWFYSGPPAAQVTAVSTERQPVQSFDSFEIRS